MLDKYTRDASRTHLRNDQSILDRQTHAQQQQRGDKVESHHLGERENDHVGRRERGRVRVKHLGQLQQKAAEGQYGQHRGEAER